MSTLGNILWFLCGGFISAFLWLLASAIMFISIIGIPWARSCLVIAQFNLCPFGRELIKRSDLSGKYDLGTGLAGLLGNIIWFIFAGWWIALAHLGAACILALTIIGIPFAIQHLKLAAISLFPVGKQVVKKHLAQAARLQDAQQQLAEIRGASPLVKNYPIQTQLEHNSLPTLPERVFQIARGEEILGSYGSRDITQNLQSGILLPTDWYWDEATEEWKALAEFHSA
jgi:uncharacterized membrane protein YccF (DUF307 family)